MKPMVVLAVAANVEDADRFAGRHTDARLLVTVNHSGKPCSHYGNRMLDTGNAQVVGLVHADVTLGPGSLDAFYACALAGNVCGIVGRDLNRAYRWCGPHECHGSKGLAPGNPAPVSTLDGCSVFLRTDLGLRFDEETFDSWHCHVEDLCLQAQARGIPVVVPAADARHPLITRHINLESWYREAEVYRKRLREKWAGVRFEHT